MMDTTLSTNHSQPPKEIVKDRKPRYLSEDEEIDVDSFCEMDRTASHARKRITRSRTKTNESPLVDYNS
jgi:hypothetical protein